MKPNYIVVSSSPHEKRFNCPKCGDSKYHLYINTNTKRGICHRCNYTPSKKEIFDLFKGLIIPDIEKKPEIEYDGYFPKQVTKLKNLSEHEVSELMKLYKKTFTKEELLFYYPFWSEEFPYIGLIFPFYENTILKGFACRTFNKDRKWVFSKGTKVSKMLYNYETAKKYSTIILTEGIWDAIRVGKNAVAVFGHFLSDAQFDLLKKSKAKEIILMFDPDVVYSEMMRTLKKINSFFEVKIAVLPKGKDPGDSTKEEIENYLKRAIKMDEYILSFL